MITVSQIRRGLRKPPHIIVHRLLKIIKEKVRRHTIHKRAAKFNLNKLLKYTKAENLSQLWQNLSQRSFIFERTGFDHEQFLQAYPTEGANIFAKAQQALDHCVDLLGSGSVWLGPEINWHQDYKTGTTWPVLYMRLIDYRNPERSSDVKFPWELSRMQWLIPAGQAYLMTRDQRYAVLVKSVIEDWINANPYGYGINWACTMEVALRIITWTWFFHVFHDSAAWSDNIFQQRFLTSLFLHAEFTAKHLELSDINGNHYTADAAGLCFAGLFFGNCKQALRWAENGWKILITELPRQVFEDGVDFEASIAYHRLVLELFFLPARYREILALPVPVEYRSRLIKMAYFAQAYSRPDGSSPLFGDADDARTLPFGSQKLTDHRYLMGLIGLQWQEQGLLADYVDPMAGEIYWLQGMQNLQQLLNTHRHTQKISSCTFPCGGFYIMRNSEDHIFIDCGPVGLADRGGHGHNDCLSFEAMLDRQLLISDCGAYVYTASYEQRNLFRSTAYHNTPQIDGEEINRLVRWDDLWHFHPDAKHKLLDWQTTPDYTLFSGIHTGYCRLQPEIIVKRTIRLDHAIHQLTIKDE
ncbi:MAG: alginate lyase family protein, partial [Proteobacteria bacterium]|nr:alginate lyase family protein [Pseudomonadota bacterium]